MRDRVMNGGMRETDKLLENGIETQMREWERVVNVRMRENELSGRMILG